MQKTVRLATDGEIYTEGKDMLIYSSAEDGCYLLFASEGDTVSSWARSLAMCIDVRDSALVYRRFIPVYSSSRSLRSVASRWSNMRCGRCCSVLLLLLPIYAILLSLVPSLFAEPSVQGRGHEASVRGICTGDRHI